MRIRARFIGTTLAAIGLAVGVSAQVETPLAPVEMAEAKPADLSNESEVFRNLAKFAEILARAQQNHYDHPDAEKLIEGAIRGLLRTLDPYSQYYTPAEYQELQKDTQGKFGGLGMYIGIKHNRLTVVAPIEGTPAWKAGALAGDRIVSIDNESTAEMTSEDAANKMRGEPGTDVTITIVREGADEPITLTLTRDIITEVSVKSATLAPTLGYIRLTQFKESTAEALGDAIEQLTSQGATGLILDLRSNPGGLLSSAVDCASYFLKPGELVVYTQGNNQREDYLAVKQDRRTDLPLIVIVNNGSASASEILAGALKAHRRALVVGQTTFGKASVQKIFALNEGGEAGAVKLTTFHYYTPDGVDIHTLGVSPDVEIPGFSPLETRMWRKARASEALKKFIEGEADDVLDRLNALKPDDAASLLRRKYRRFLDDLAAENIALSDDLLKHAIALETVPDTDDYATDPQIRAAAQYLRAFQTFRELRSAEERAN